MEDEPVDIVGGRPIIFYSGQKALDLTRHPNLIGTIEGMRAASIWPISPYRHGEAHIMIGESANGHGRNVLVRIFGFPGEAVEFSRDAGVVRMLNGPELLNDIALDDEQSGLISGFLDCIEAIHTPVQH